MGTKVIDSKNQTVFFITHLCLQETLYKLKYLLLMFTADMMCISLYLYKYACLMNAYMYTL